MHEGDPIWAKSDEGETLRLHEPTPLLEKAVYWLVLDSNAADSRCFGVNVLARRQSLVYQRRGRGPRFLDAKGKAQG